MMKKLAIFILLLCTAVIVSARSVEPKEGLTLEDIRMQYPAVYEHFKFKLQSHPADRVLHVRLVDKTNKVATSQETLTGPLTSGAGLTLEDVRVQYPDSYEEVKAAALEDPFKQWSVEEIENAGK